MKKKKIMREEKAFLYQRMPANIFGKNDEGKNNHCISHPPGQHNWFRQGLGTDGEVTREQGVHRLTTVTPQINLHLRWSHFKQGFSFVSPVVEQADAMSPDELQSEVYIQHHL